ncbi:PREDICTED: uncharacterized protein LOC105456562 [Wasmannia auropunctata]|uniref:uncharacterized protein LOC105456562 n=1 Tax=Wasmannia auropunctata TaxID=64793 RepID=UPI0005F09AD0|nr:PREDICTED: uncharacterized protein LOC105456562 [Wasmannia auropunctata]
MSFYNNHYYNFNKTSLCIIGQWPFQSRLKKNAMFAVTVFFLASLTALEVFWGLLAGITDLSIIMENTSPLLVNLFIIIKLVNSFSNSCKMKELLEHIEETWKEMYDGPQSEILRHYAEESKILTTRYAIGLYAMWLFYTTPPIVISGMYTLLPTNETYSARLLSLLGQWPFQKKRHRRIILVTVSFIGLTQALAQILALVTLRDDLDAMLECIPPLIIDSACIIKLTNLVCNSERIKMLLIHIQRDWQSLAIKSEFEILHKFSEAGRSLTIGYAIGMYAFGSLFPFLAIIPKIIGKNVTSEYATRPVGYPYHVEYYIDLEKYYYPVLIHNYLTSAIRLTTIVASDTYVAILVLHCCALFSIVRFRLEYIRKCIEQDKVLASLKENDKFYKNFVYCIQKHIDALRFAKRLDTAYTKAFFLEVGVVILLMSLSALQATTTTLNTDLAIRHGALITAQLLHLYMACWLGQQQKIRDRMGDIEQFFQDSHYNIIRVLLSISGLWPFHTRNRRYAIYLAMVLILGSGFIFEMMGVIEARYDSFEVIDALPLFCYAIVTLSKTCYAVYTLPKIKMLLIKMQELCLSPKSDEETKIQNSHARYGRKLGYIYMGFSALYQLSTLAMRLLYAESKETHETSNKEQIGLPHRVNYMVDLDTYYYPIFIHSAVCDFSLAFLLVVFDVLYLTVVEYCCGLFASLRYRLETALIFENDRSTMTTTRDKSYANIAYSIRRHTETMQFIAIMESVYSLPLLIHIGLTVLIISVLEYQVLNNMEHINRLIKPTTYLAAILINVFFENWQGQKIIDSSEKVFESAYNTEWYSMPVAARKLLIMMMMRSEKPSTLKMGKIVVLSHITFNTVLRTSSSYFMLLRSL